MSTDGAFGPVTADEAYRPMSFMMSGSIASRTLAEWMPNFIETPQGNI